MIVLLDNGHGGLIDGVYQTPGKRSPKWDDGSQLFEGEFNRAIVCGIVQELTSMNINYVVITPEHEDISLKERVRRANKYDASESVFISIHSNAGGGHGSEIFTSPGQTKSDKIASVIGEEFKIIFPLKRLRTDFSDGDLDKEERFYVLTRTRMPAVLTENFFMDNEEECKNILLKRSGRDKVIEFHINAIVRVKEELY
jgi:N-acetylmuramoyl-L-alanine amidase